jgi:hypothetical protein
MCKEDTLFSDIVDLDPIAKNLPETKMMRNAAEAGNWGDPYGDEASGWDFLGAGPGAQITSGGQPILGQLDPNDPKDRSTGRTIGTAAALYFGAGALGAEGTTAATGTTAGTEAAATYGAAGEFAGAGAAETAGAAAAAAEAGTSASGPAAATTATTAAAPTATAKFLATAKTVATVLQPALILAQASSNAQMARELKQQSELKAPAPVTLPTRGNENTIIAQQAALRQQLSRRGRASTILTSPGGEKFGAA